MKRNAPYSFVQSHPSSSSDLRNGTEDCLPRGVLLHLLRLLYVPPPYSPPDLLLHLMMIPAA
ncbi:hypothetical protein SLEP1_g57914 [Rubroshorea leprosula]|uniref:Uncharacterized protein n=1 Tax=Rubroshorea leprosula TaxID=152421 RepID=A0AAV5MMK8_9ROSI|nr:hypothetical protein SLEP1_g57914 [Rubroshorea leprosula]